MSENVMETLRARSADWLTNFEFWITAAGLPYEAPLICENKDLGEVSFEWWGEEKKLTIFLDEQDVSYIRVDHYKSDPLHGRMEDGPLPHLDTAELLWYWFTH